jgi:hypothetical protein
MTSRFAILPYCAAIPWWNVVPLYCTQCKYTLYREATQWWLHLVVDLGTNGRFTNVPMQLTWAKNLKTRPSFQIHSNVYPNGSIWLYWFFDTEISTIGLLYLVYVKYYGGPLPPMGYPLKVLWPGPATNMLFLQIYQKYFIIEQTYNKNKLFLVL